MKNLLVLGATSGIAQAYINRVAERFENIVLVARDSRKLAQLSSHVATVSKATVSTIESDLSDSARHEELIARVITQMGSIDCALISYGQLTDQSRCVEDASYAMEQFNLNGTSTISQPVSGSSNVHAKRWYTCRYWFCSRRSRSSE